MPSILALYEHYLVHRRVAMDSRQVTPQSLFFALRGPRFDGHAFAEQALLQGASYAVIDDPRYKKDERYIMVEDVLGALQQLATHHRQQLSIPIIGITGSSGKTTTKELIQAVLCSRYHVTATKGNLNNHIGVPLTLLAMDSKTEIGVVEMGANHVGEIARLCTMAMPTHGLITNVGRVHIEGFGSLEGVIKGKGELYDYLHQHQATVFVNTTDPTLSRMVSPLTRRITYPQRQDFCHCSLVSESPEVVYQSSSGQVVHAQLLGRYHLNNIASALCVAQYFQVDERQANAAIQAYRPSNNRSQIIKKGSNTILLDAYNANLASTQEAIRSLHLLSAEHRVLILGDMAELGAESIAAHSTLVRLTAQRRYAAVFLCGPCMEAASVENTQALYFPEKALLATHLARQWFSDTAFLIKGSRFLRLETLVEAIH